MVRFIPWITALTLLLSVGLVHGLWTERWHASAALEHACAQVETVPLEIGDWQGSDVEVDNGLFALAGARAYWARTYTDRRGGGTVLAILMCGRSGKMSVHTPEICYRGAGYDLLQEPARTILRDDADEELGTFWSARFSRQSGTANDLRLYWAWSAGDGWEAPVNPRWAFRGRPYLYKLYVSHELAASSDLDPSAEFLRQLLPVLKERLP
jgi:hypothetical protein